VIFAPTSDSAQRGPAGVTAQHFAEFSLIFLLPLALIVIGTLSSGLYAATSEFSERLRQATGKEISFRNSIGIISLDVQRHTTQYQNAQLTIGG